MNKNYNRKFIFSWIWSKKGNGGVHKALLQKEVSAKGHHTVGTPFTYLQ